MILTNNYLKGYLTKVYRHDKKVYLGEIVSLDKMADTNDMVTGDVRLLIQDRFWSSTEFFGFLEKRLLSGYYMLREIGDNYITMRYGNNSFGVAEDRYVFQEGVLEDSRVNAKFEELKKKALAKYPDYKQVFKEERYAYNLGKLVTGYKDIEFDKMQDIPEFRKFYKDNKSAVEKVVRKRIREKYPYCADFLICFMCLYVINQLFFINKGLPLMFAGDVVVASLLYNGEGILKKFLTSRVADKSVDNGIDDYQKSVLMTCDEEVVTTRDKIRKALKTDLDLIMHLKYDGYEVDINTLYELGDQVNGMDGDEQNRGNMEMMRDILNRLVDVERVMCLQMGYYGELNAEMLLDEEDKGENRSLKLVF